MVERKNEEGLRANLRGFKTKPLKIDELELTIGRIVTPIEEEGYEPPGPLVKLSIRDLRFWDNILLNRYKPFYAPLCDLCCFCTYGKCDLTEDRKGACGIDSSAHQARWSLLQSIIGMCTHFGHAKELVEWLIEKKGPNIPIYIGDHTPIEAPIIRTITGIVPKKLGDLLEAIEYVDSQIADLIASLHVGQESSYLDFESKTFHAGMLDSLSMEIADIAQICGLDYPKAEISAPLVEIGFGTIDRTKPVILCIGHNVAPSSEVVNYAQQVDLEEKIEICGLCCTAIDTTRYEKRAKIVGPMSRTLKFVRSGVADVVMVDEQCVRVDILSEAEKIKAPMIATSVKAMHGLPDMTDDDPDKIVSDLVSGTASAALILEPEKAGEVAVRVAMEIAPRRAKYKEVPEEKVLIELAKKCIQCKECEANCPNHLPISDAIGIAAKGDLSNLAELEDFCLGCARCDSECRHDIPVLSMITKAAEKKLKEERCRIRAGRGPIQDYEIRMVCDDWGLGMIPGCIGLIGCANYPGAAKDVYEMAKWLLERNYIVCATGCAAMVIGMYKDEEGKTLYETYPSLFDYNGMLNVGSCVSNAHIIGAGIRLASVFGRRILRGNFAEIADYLLNRVGACGIAWGAMSPKAHAIAEGFNRWGVPAILGPQGLKYKRLYLGRKEDKESYMVGDWKGGELRYVGSLPEHLLYAAETPGEALAMAAKLCMRSNDMEEGRQTKLQNYCTAHLQFFGRLPDDLHLFIRNEMDIPPAHRGEIMKKLKEANWEPLKLDWTSSRDVTTLPPDKFWTYEALRRGYRWITV